MLKYIESLGIIAPKAVYYQLSPAVLTENLFQDNLADVEYLLSEAGKEAIAELHVEGIMKYIFLTA